jgi:hypothetical protein
MAITKSQLENLIYRKYEIGSAPISDLRQPSASEKTTMNNIVNELMGYILTKHS